MTLIKLNQYLVKPSSFFTRFIFCKTLPCATRRMELKVLWLRAEATLSGVELHHMLRKNQHQNSDNMTIFEQFNALAA